MPIYMVEDDEEFQLQVEDGSITFRRVPPFQLDRIENANTVNGVRDHRGVIRDTLAYAILRWEGFVDKHDTPVPVDTYWRDRMPENLRKTLIEVVFTNVRRDRAILGNSSNGLSANPPLMASTVSGAEPIAPTTPSPSPVTTLAAVPTSPVPDSRDS